MTPLKLIAAPLALGALLAALPAAVPVAMAQSIHECSGVGLDDREAAATVPHTLRLEYAQPDGHYLGDIQTVITGAGGAEVLSVRCPGPWLLVDLPAGSYQIAATFQGQTKTFGVSVGGGKPTRKVVVF